MVSSMAGLESVASSAVPNGSPLPIAPVLIPLVRRHRSPAPFIADSKPSHDDAADYQDSHRSRDVQDMFQKHSILHLVIGELESLHQKTAHGFRLAP